MKQASTNTISAGSEVGWHMSNGSNAKEALNERNQKIPSLAKALEV
jgi:hypothetical protein